MKLSTARLTALLTFTLCAAQARTARADTPELSSSIETPAFVPTSATKELLLSLQVLVPLARSSGTRLLGGIGPVAMTRQLLNMTIPNVVGLGAAGAFRLEF